jgi:hypothetical protein
LAPVPLHIPTPLHITIAVRFKAEHAAGLMAFAFMAAVFSSSRVVGIVFPAATAVSVLMKIRVTKTQSIVR